MNESRSRGNDANAGQFTVLEDAKPTWEAIGEKNDKGTAFKAE